MAAYGFADGETLATSGCRIDPLALEARAKQAGEHGIGEAPNAPIHSGSHKHRP